MIPEFQKLETTPICLYHTKRCQTPRRISVQILEQKMSSLLHLSYPASHHGTLLLEEQTLPYRIQHHMQTLVISGFVLEVSAKSISCQLRHLAGLIRKPSTPQRRASSTSALSAKSRTPGARRPLQARLTSRSNPATPYAIRALQQRRATPGRDRRKSGRTQRETPRDALRNLSRSQSATRCPLNRADGGEP